MVRVRVATSRAHLGTVDEDEWLVAALANGGMEASLAAWDDASEEWDCDVVVVRSVWGYQHHLPAFLAWLDRLDERRIVVLNPSSMIRANIDKVAQLAWLDASAVPHVPTALIRSSDADAGAPLARLVADRLPDAPAVVLKPAVSASGHDTILVDPSGRTGSAGASVDDAERMLAEVLSRPGNRGVLVQPFLPQIDQGEHALVYLGGRFSHCFVRFPGLIGRRRESAHVEAPEPAHLSLAEGVLACLDEVPTYARVDVLDSASGPLVMELELAEPFLGFGLLPPRRRADAMARFVAAVERGSRARAETGSRRQHP